nr:hypothetical protein [Paucibacter sp. M5-1]MCZ7882323.1 hypothetical protein [Paucibacter sp. M5-1]
MHALVEMGAIGQLGQRVVQGHEAQPLLGLAARIDVGQRADDAQRPALLVALDHGGARQHPVPIAAATGHPVLADQAGAVPIQAALQLGLQARQVLGMGAGQQLRKIRLALAGPQPHDGLPARRAADAAVGGVQIPDAVAGPFQREGPALLALAQRPGHAFGQRQRPAPRGSQQPGQQRQQHRQADAGQQDGFGAERAAQAGKTRLSLQAYRPGVAAHHQKLLGLQQRPDGLVLGRQHRAVQQPVRSQLLAVVQRQQQTGRQLAVEAGHQLLHQHRRHHPAAQPFAPLRHRDRRLIAAIDRQGHQKAGRVAGLRARQGQLGRQRQPARVARRLQHLGQQRLGQQITPQH